MGSYKKATEVLISTKNPDFKEVDTGKRKLKFGKSGAMVIRDPGEGRAVEERYGFESRRKGGTGEVVTMAVDDYHVDPGHKYAFTAPGVPWAKYDSLGRRLPDGQESEDERENGHNLDGAEEEADQVQEGGPA